MVLVLCAIELFAPNHCHCRHSMVGLVQWCNLSNVRVARYKYVRFPLSNCLLGRSLFGMASQPSTSDSGTSAPSYDGSSEVNHVACLALLYHMQLHKRPTHVWIVKFIT